MAKQVKADIVLLAITAVWGSSFILMKNVLEHLPSFTYLSLRFLIATVVLVIIFYKSLRTISRRTWLYGCIIGLMLSGGMALQVFGLNYTSASNSAFITGLYIVFVPIVSAVFLKKKPNIPSTIGVILAGIGLFFLTGGLNFKFNIGDFLTFLCAIAFTFQIIFIDKFTADENPIQLAVIQVGFSAAAYVILWFTTGLQTLTFNGSVITTLLITGLLGTAFGFAAQTIVQKDTTPTHAVLIFTAEPVFGAIFALIIPNSAGITETLKVNSIVGCVLILVGMLVSEFKIGRRKREVEGCEI